MITEQREQNYHKFCYIFHEFNFFIVMNSWAVRVDHTGTLFFITYHMITFLEYVSSHIKEAE